MTEPEPTPAEKKQVRRDWRTVAVMVGAIVVVAVAALLLLGRYGVLTGPGREIVSSFVQGRELGRVGRLNVEGLRGDLWDDFTLDRVTITDSEGVWLEARNVRVDWTYWPLITRRFHADLIEAEVVHVYRRPVLAPEVRPPGPLPVTVDIDRFRGRVELHQDFAKEYGRWDLEGDATLMRGRNQPVEVRATGRSVTRPGDYLRAHVRTGGPQGLHADVEAFEARGGPLAGALGYAADRPFTAVVKATGELTGGRFGAVVRTGDVTALDAAGDWSERGADVWGRISFAQSDLLDDYVRRVGPVADFRFVAVRSSTGNFGVAWRLNAENLTSRARGVVSPDRRAVVDGLTLRATTGSLSRLLGEPGLAGAADVQGVWRGDLDRWTFEGSGEVGDVSAGDYRLQRVSGPIRLIWRDDRLTADATLTGAGGRGTGLLARLAGPSPRAEFTLVRQADGRMLLEQIDARGAGLAVRGAGGRGLGGGLNFRGRATLTDPAAIRPGATGAVEADLRAERPRTAQAWNVVLDARGRRFATGLAQLDRLLGAQPRLQAAGVLGEGGRVRIDRARLDGAAAQATGSGVIGPAGRLDLDLDWTARGPFQAGPVEVVGTMRGTGSLGGTAARPEATLQARFDEIDLAGLSVRDATVQLAFARDARGFDGRVAATGATGFGPAVARSAFRFTGDGVRLEELFVDAGGVRAEGLLALRRGAPTAADLNFVAVPGAFIQAGSARGSVRLVDAPGRTHADAWVDVTAQNLRLPQLDYTFRTLRLQGQGTTARLPFQAVADVAGPVPVTFEGGGVYGRTNGTHTVALEGRGSVRRVPFRTNVPAVFSFNGGERAARVDLTVAGGRLAGEVVEGPREARLQAVLDRVDLRALTETLDGRASGRVDLAGAGRRLEGTADLRFEQARSLEGPRQFAIDGVVRARLEGASLTVHGTARDARGLQAQTRLVLPVQASASPLRLAVVRNRPMNGDFAVRGEIRPIWDMLVGADRSLSGVVDAQGVLGGSLNDPRITGQASVRQGRFVDGASGLVLANLATDMRFDADAVQVTTFQAVDEQGGRVQGSGRLGLRPGSPSSFTLNLARFQLIDTDLAEARVSGPVTVTRNGEGAVRLVGRLTVDEADVSPTQLQGGGPGIVTMAVREINVPVARRREAPEPQPRGPDIALDVTLTAPGQINIRGAGLNLEFGLDARVQGTMSRPRLSGVANVVRGDWEFAGRRFVFDERGRIVLGDTAADVRLDLRATREDPTLTATVAVRGSAAEPEISLSSTPQLPQDEILSQILFGRSAAQLSAIEAAQLAAAIASLAGGGGFDVVDNLREFVGLDRLRVIGEPGGLAVAGGRYLSDDIYLELIGGGREGTAVQVEWRARRNIAVLSRIAAQGDTRLAVRYRREVR